MVPGISKGISQGHTFSRGDKTFPSIHTANKNDPRETEHLRRGSVAEPWPRLEKALLHPSTHLPRGKRILREVGGK